jgi:hypothetical protein
MKMKLFVATMLLGLSACAESSTDAVKRTKKYLDYVNAVQTAQEKLNAFVGAEQKACEAAGSNLQMSGSGVLACVAKPPAPQIQPPATNPAPATSKK